MEGGWTNFQVLNEHWHRIHSVLECQCHCVAPLESAYAVQFWAQFYCSSSKSTPSFHYFHSWQGQDFWLGPPEWMKFADYHHEHTPIHTSCIGICLRCHLNLQKLLYEGSVFGAGTDYLMSCWTSKPSSQQRNPKELTASGSHKWPFRIIPSEVQFKALLCQPIEWSLQECGGYCQSYGKIHPPLSTSGLAQGLT